jgi:type IV pilus assembly protein PilC
MATSSLATAKPRAKESIKSYTFAWEGLDRSGKPVRGELRAASEAVVSNTLRRQGIRATKVKKLTFKGSSRVKEKDIALFTRQMAAMVKSGVPMLQAFDIAARSTGSAGLSKILMTIKSDVESGLSLNQAFRKHPLHFDDLYCNLVGAGESAGILDEIMDRLAVYKEKILAIKGQIKSALFYPAMVITVAIVVVSIIMWFVIPQFKGIFSSVGKGLPWITEFVISVSDWFTKWWWAVVLVMVGTPMLFTYFYKRSANFRHIVDRFALKIPVIGVILEKSSVARWARTLATMFAAGVPLVEALNTVGGAAGNRVFELATKKIQASVSTGQSLTLSMDDTKIFPQMAVQMTRIGEETGALDTMLTNVANFYDREVDDAVAALSSLIEPMLMVVLGGVIGTIVIAMYLPIFKLGQAF